MAELLSVFFYLFKRKINSVLCEDLFVLCAKTYCIIVFPLPLIFKVISRMRVICRDDCCTLSDPGHSSLILHEHILLRHQDSHLSHQPPSSFSSHPKHGLQLPISIRWQFLRAGQGQLPAKFMSGYAGIPRIESYKLNRRKRCIKSRGGHLQANMWHWNQGSHSSTVPSTITT